MPDIFPGYRYVFMTIACDTMKSFSVNADEMDDERDPCRVNATMFALREFCSLRCVERRDDDGCFVCNRACNGI